MKRLKSSLAVILAVLMIIGTIPMAAFAFSTSDYFRVFEGATYNSDSLKTVGPELTVVENEKITHDSEYVRITTTSSTDAVKNWSSYVLLDNSDMGSRKDITAYAMFIDFSESASWLDSQNLDVAFKLLNEEGKELDLYKNAKASVTAYTISTVTGKKTKVNNQSTGGIRLPHGFIGWLVIEMDNKSTTLDYSTVAGISLKRINTETNVGFSNTNIYFDDVYAIRNIDKFVAAVQSPALGMMAGSDAIKVTADTEDANKRNWTVSWTSVNGAVEYAVNAYDPYGVDSGAGYRKNATSATFLELFLFDAYDNIQVIAYDASGNVLAISKPTIIRTIASYEMIGDAVTAADGSDVAGHEFTDGIILADVIGNGEYESDKLPSVDSVNTADGGQVKQLNLSPAGDTEANDTISYAYAIDVNAPTLEVVNGFAVFADFSEFKYDDYWRPYTVDNTVVKKSQFGAASVGNGAGSHNAYTYGRATAWSDSVKKGKATLINTKTGEVLREQSFVKEGGGLGAFRVPAGFVGYIYFEFDDKSNSAVAATAMSNVGAFVIHRRNNAVAGTSHDKTVANMNQLSLNIESNYYLGDVFAVNEIDVFVSDILAGKIGKLAGDADVKATFVPTAATTTVEVKPIENAVSYVVNIFDNTYKLLKTKTTNTVTCDFGTDLGTDIYAQVVAYNEAGNAIAVTGVAKAGACNHDYELYEVLDVETSCQHPGAIGYKCYFCGNTYTDPVAQLDHEYELTNTVPASCMVDGAYTYTCKLCNIDTYDVPILHPGHSWYYDEDIPATCTEPGSYKRHCTVENCGVQESGVRPASHDWKLETKDPTTTEAGYTVNKCDRCGEYDEDTREIISKINPYGAINGATDEYLIARGRRSIVEYTTYSPAAMANGEAGYGPSVKYMHQQQRAYGSLITKLDLNGANGFAFYMDIDMNSHYSGEYANRAHVPVNNYFDIAFGTTLHERFTTPANNSNANSTALMKDNTPVIGGWGKQGNGGYVGADAANNITPNYNITFKTYDIQTGELREGQFNEDASSNAGINRDEMIIPAGFKGYVIVDLSNYTTYGKNGANTAPAINDVKQLVIERSQDLNVLDANGVNWSGKGYSRIAYDNFFAITDIEAFLFDIDDNLSNLGTMYATEGNTVAYTSNAAAKKTGYVTETYTATAVPGATEYKVNVYKLAADGDTLERIATGSSTTNAVKVVVPVETNVYVQSVAYTANGIVASVPLNRTTSAAPAPLLLMNAIKPTMRNDFAYEVTAEGIVITDYIGSVTNAIIPSAIGGMEVVAIADGAFENANIVEVTIPETVKSIGKNAFAGCTALKVVNYKAIDATCLGTNVDSVFPAKQVMTVNIGSDVKSIPAYLFYGVSVTELNFADDATITSIGLKAFEGNRIVTLVLPDSLEVIGGHAFRGAIALKTLKTGKNLKEIGEYAFALSYKLETVEFAEGLYKLNNLAFYKASTMVAETVEILLPNSLGYYATSNHAFRDANVILEAYNNSYADLYINVVDVTPIGYYHTVLAETDFATVDVAGGVKIVGFSGVYTKYMAIPETIGGKEVVAIGFQAFFNGRSNTVVQSIKLPETVVTVEQQAFRAMVNLVNAEMPGATKIERWAFVLCPKLETAVYAENAVIAAEAFRDSVNLK